MKKLFAYWRKILRLIYQKRVSTIAGSLSFFFVMSVVPMAFLAFYIVYFFTERIGMHHELDWTQFLQFDFTSPISLFFMVTTIYSASKMFFHLRRSGELIFGYKDRTKSLAVRFNAIINMLLFIFVIASGIITIVLVKEGLNNIMLGWAYRIIASLFLIMLFLFSLLVVNKYAAQGEAKLWKYYKGALFTFVFDVVITIGFVVYITYFANYAYLYAFLASIIISLLYIYLLMQGLIYGFLINSKYVK